MDQAFNNPDLLGAVATSSRSWAAPISPIRLAPSSQRSRRVRAEDERRQADVKKMMAGVQGEREGERRRQKAGTTEKGAKSKEPTAAEK